MKELIQSFIVVLSTAKGYSENTCRSYRSDLLEFADIVKGIGLSGKAFDDPELCHRQIDASISPGHGHPIQIHNQRAMRYKTGCLIAAGERINFSEQRRHACAELRH